VRQVITLPVLVHADEYLGDLGGRSIGLLGMNLFKQFYCCDAHVI